MRSETLSKRIVVLSLVGLLGFFPLIGKAFSQDKSDSPAAISGKDSSQTASPPSSNMPSDVLFFFEYDQDGHQFKVNYSCADSSNGLMELHQTLWENLRTNGVPVQATGLWDKILLTRGAQEPEELELTGWSERIVEYVEEPTQGSYPKDFMAYGRLATVELCSGFASSVKTASVNLDFNTEHVDFSPTVQSMSISGFQIELQNLSAPSSETDADICTLLKDADPASTGLQTFVFITEPQAQSYFDAQGSWVGVPFTEQQINDQIMFYMDNFLKRGSPINRNRTKIYRLKTDQNYSMCESNTAGYFACSDPALLSHAMTACGLGPATAGNINAYLLLGTTQLNGLYGHAFLNSRSLVVKIGYDVLEYLNTYPYSSVQQVQPFREIDLNATVQAILFHEMGHQMYVLDHTNCNTTAPKNDPHNLCFTTQGLCQFTTQNMCVGYPFNNPTWYVALTTGHVSGGGSPSDTPYMHAYIHGGPLPTETDYQFWGSPHISDNVIPFRYNQLGITNFDKAVCGNGIIEEGEDADPGPVFHNPSNPPNPDFYPSDLENIHVASCAAVNRPEEDFKDINPLKTTGWFSGGVYQGFWFSNPDRRKSAYVPTSLKQVSLNKKNCRLTIPCYQSDGWNGYRNGLPVDCHWVDYRFISGRQYHNFGNQRCTPLANDLRLDQPIFKEHTNNFGISYVTADSSAPSVKTLNFMTLHNSGAVISSESASIQPNVKKIKVLEGSAYQRVGDYDPAGSALAGNQNYFYHPLYVVQVNQEGIYVWGRKLAFTDGFNANMPRYFYDVLNQHGPIMDVIDVSFYEKNFQIVVTYRVQNGQTYQVRFETNQATGPTAALIYYDINHLYQNDGRYVGVGWDSRTLYSAGFRRNSWIYEGVDFIQGASAATLHSFDFGQTAIPLHTDLISSIDKIGRPTFTWIENGDHSGQMKLMHATRARRNKFRIDAPIPFDVQSNTNTTQYPISSNNRPKTKFNKEAKMYTVVPLPVDNELAFIDPSGTVVHFPYTPTLGADQSDAFDLTLHENTVMYPSYSPYYASAESRETRAVILTRQKNSTESKLVLYIQEAEGSSQFEEIVLRREPVTLQYDKISISSAGAGPKDFPGGQMVCTETSTGLLAGHPGFLHDRQGKYFLIRANSASSNWDVFSLGDDGVYGTGDDQFVSSAPFSPGPNYTILQAQIISGLPPNSIFDQTQGAYIYFFGFDSASNNYYAWLADQNIISYVRSPQIPLSPTMEPILSGGELFAIDWPSGEFSKCDVMNCQFQLLYTFTNTTGLGTPYQIADGVIVFKHSSQTYIYDNNGMHSYPQAVKYVEQLDEGVYKLIYPNSTATGMVQETITTNGGIQSLQTTGVPANFQVNDRIAGDLNVSGTNAIVVQPFPGNGNIRLRKSSPGIDGECAANGAHPIERIDANSASVHFLRFDNTSQTLKIFKASQQ